MRVVADYGQIDVMERYCEADLTRVPHSKDSTLVFAQERAKAKLLPSMVAAALGACRDLKPLSEHAKDIWRPLNAMGKVRVYRQFLTYALKNDVSPVFGGPGMIAAVLERLAADGLLLSRAQLVETGKDWAAAAPPPPQIASLAVVTCARLPSLKRCLESFIANAKAHGRRNDFVVVDDSKKAETRAEARAMLRELKAASGMEILYAGLEEKTAFAKALEGRGVPADVLDFALFDPEGCGMSAGANRNALTLHSVGDMVLSVDDDTVCTTASGPERLPGLALSNRPDPTQFWFFKDRAEATAAAKLEDADALGVHERLLGKTVGRCLAELSPEEVEGFTETAPGFLDRIQRRRGAVLYTLNGLFGSSGVGSPEGYLFTRGRARERMMRSEAQYRAAVKSTEVHRSVDRPTIDTGNFCMAGFLGLDNRELLPPFMPVLRNEDSIFGIILRLCFEDGLVGFLPWMLLHQPPERREYTEDAKPQPAKLWTYDVITAAISSWPPGWSGLPGRERMMNLGKHLSDIGSLAPADFRRGIESMVLRMRSESAAGTEALLKKHRGKPAYWARDVQRRIEKARAGIEDPNLDVPWDLAQKRGAEAARELSQRLVARFGKTLRHWPATVDAARALRAEGRRLAQPV